VIVIKNIIFNLDGTLCDYEKARDCAFKEVNKALSEYGVDEEGFWNDYKKFKPKLLRKFVAGIISREDYQIRQYADVLKDKVSKPIKLSYKLNEIYINNLKMNLELFEDVKQTLDELKEKSVNMAILSNGNYHEQLEKYKILQLYKFMPLYVDEKIGFRKPNINSYSYVLIDLSLKKAETILVSESISDYNGAKYAGIDAVLIDRKNYHKDFKGNRIDRFDDLIDMLLNDNRF
jgi:putative hydrolase of the HAD superfamily